LSWAKIKVLVVTKAYPERSKKYGTVACTAGITDDGNWIRLYPIDIRHFFGKYKISKFDIIEVECKADSDRLCRKESHKIRPDSIRIIDKTLTKPRVDWEKRSNLILPMLDNSIEILQDKYKSDKISLGLIKPIEILDFQKTDDLELYENQSWSFTNNLNGEIIPRVTKIPHILKYRFKCKGCKNLTHNMQCEDWELFESYRSWGKRYKNVDILWKKLKGRYYNWMLKNRDLYFIMGMYSRYPTWFIIGLYYPPKSRFTTTL
jgi:hypothetical protein